MKKARRYSLEPAFSRGGWFKSMSSKSYWSYGKVNHKDEALIPEGRVLIDMAKSFVYTEGGLKGVLDAVSHQEFDYAMEFMHNSWLDESRKENRC